MVEEFPNRGFVCRYHFVAEGVRSVFKLLEAAKREKIVVVPFEFVGDADADFATG